MESVFLFLFLFISISLSFSFYFPSFYPVPVPLSDFPWQSRTTDYFSLVKRWANVNCTQQYLVSVRHKISHPVGYKSCHFIQEWCKLQLFLLQLWDLPSNLPLKWIVFFRDCLLATIMISALIIFTVPSMWFQKLMPVIWMSVCTLSVAFCISSPPHQPSWLVPIKTGQSDDRTFSLVH